MHYFDPARPRLPNGLPAWRDAPNIALPRLIIVPLEEDYECYMVEAMINSSWKHFYTSIYSISLDSVLFKWKSDPEQFAHDYFGVESIQPFTYPTTVSIVAESLPSINPADLGI